MTAATQAAGLKWYHYPEQYQHLLEQTGEHELHVLHHDGLYRHLRFQKPGTGIWHWDLVTWPGSLAIRGDIGEGHIFTRERDMLTFFDHGQPDGHINPGYWAEKLDRGCRSVKEFSEDKFRAWVTDHELTFDSDQTGYIYTTSEAIDYCESHGISWDCDDPESWEDYGYHFILALHAILWGAKKYHAEVPS